MMYLVQPTSLQWTNIGHLSPEQFIKLGGNLEAIDDWQTSERPLSNSDVAIALRYGVPVSAGIIVEAIHIIDKERPRELREVHENAKRAHQHPTIKATDDFIDKYLAPGWKQHGEELDERVNSSAEVSISEAQEEADRKFDEPVKPELVAHWRRVGGYVPE